MAHSSDSDTILVVASRAVAGGVSSAGMLRAEPLLGQTDRALHDVIKQLGALGIRPDMAGLVIDVRVTAFVPPPPTK